MTLEQLVPTLEVCQQLKAAGFPQDTALVWWKRINVDPATVHPRSESLSSLIDCAAPTAEEILKELPPYLQGSCCQLDLDVLRLSSCNINGTPAPLMWIVQWCCPEIDEAVGRQESEDSLVLAAANAYLWWKKKEVAG